MKATGIVRKVDTLGRIVIPKELRVVLGIEIKDAVEIYTDNEKIILKKYERDCIFCGEKDSSKLVNCKGKMICKKCIRELTSR